MASTLSCRAFSFFLREEESNIDRPLHKAWSHSHIQLCQSYTPRPPRRASVSVSLVSSSNVSLQCVVGSRFEAARAVSGSHHLDTGSKRTDLVVLRLRKAIRGHHAPFAVRTHPEFWVNVIFRDNLTSQNMAHEQIIVHRFRNDLSNGR